MDATLMAMLLQAASPVAPPAPPVYVPPPIVVSPAAVASRARERFVVDVEVRAGVEVLWSGPMAVSTTQSSSFTRRLAEPAPDDCAPGGYSQQIENSLSVQISPQRQFDGDTAFGLTIRWGRSLPGACPYRASSRSVELNQTVTLPTGRAVTLSGDADLTVRLRRR